MFYGQSGSYKQELSQTLIYVSKSTTFDVNNLVFKATYTDAFGEEQTVEIAGAKFTVNNKVIMVVLDTIPAKDLCSQVTGALYTVDGTQVSDAITTCFASYATSIANGADYSVEEKTLAKASIVYSNAALDYFRASK